MDAPLLLNGRDDYDDDDDTSLLDATSGDYRPVRSAKDSVKVFWTETVKLWVIGGPIAFNIICQFSINLVTTMCVGHLGNVELSSVSIAESVIGIFSFGFLLGMGSALETLCGQAYGAGEVHLLGVYMQRSMLILFVSCVFLTPIYLFANPLLKLLGQKDEIAILAGKYAILIIPQLYSMAVTFPTQKFLQAQSKVGVTAWIGLAALVMNVIMLWFFIYVLGWGIIGSAVAFNISNWFTAISQLVYVIGWCKDGWTGWSSSAFNDLWPFAKLSLASAVMLSLELWYMMSINILTGGLDNAVISVGSLTICSNLDGLQAMLFIGVNAAISVRVSNELGLGHARAAKYSVYVTVSQCLLIGVLCMVTVLFARDYFAILFTDSREMQQAVAHLAWLLGITMVLNSVQPVISGVAVGGGWQALVAYINLASYYVFGLPLGYFLGYAAHLGVSGLWGGMIAGTALQTLLLIIILYKTNWNKEVQQTLERMRKWGGQYIDTVKPSSNEIP